MPANQYSASPKDATDSMFSAVMTTQSPNAIAQTGTPGTQPLTIWPPATASKPTTMTWKYQ